MERAMSWGTEFPRRLSWSGTLSATAPVASGRESISRSTDSMGCRIEPSVGRLPLNDTSGTGAAPPPGLVDLVHRPGSSTWFHVRYHRCQILRKAPPKGVTVMHRTAVPWLLLVAVL